MKTKKLAVWIVYLLIIVVLLSPVFGEQYEQQKEEQISKGTADGEKINAGTIVWCAGVTANGLTCVSDGRETERGRICIDKKMQAINTSDVCIVGDMALSPTGDIYASVKQPSSAWNIMRFVAKEQRWLAVATIAGCMLMMRLQTELMIHGRSTAKSQSGH